MKRVLEGILAVLIAVLSCIVFINVVLRYGLRAVFCQWMNYLVISLYG